MAAQAQQSELGALAEMLKLFSGGGTKTTTTGGSETSKTEVSEQGLAAILRQALESNSGLAAVSQGQRGAGLYNSSTNRLLTNDLLSRLAGQAASATATKTVTRTPGVQTQQNAGSDLLGKAMLGLTAAQKLGLMGKNQGPLSGVASAAKPVFSEGAGLLENIVSGGSVPTADLFQANRTDDPLGALISSQGWSDTQDSDISSLTQMLSSNADGFATYSGSALDQAGLGGTDTQTLAPEGWADSVDSASSTGGSDFTNFSSASSAQTSSNASAVGEATSSLNLSGVGPSVISLYTGVKSLTDSQHENDAAGALSLTSGAYGGYKTYEAYQAYQAAQAARDAAAAAQAVEAASTASTAADTSSAAAAASSFGGGAGSGSALGYVGPILNAVFAQDNPKGEQEKDYRKAVGGAVLNYFGFGWATPIVDEIARPVLDNAMDKGTESMGTFGAVMADPVGAPLSGQYDVGELVTSTFDPGNIFGGNEGGSIGSLAAAGLDPIGAALGDEGAFSVFQDAINSDPGVSFIQDVFQGGGCFLTTACMKYMADTFDDDCHELTTLRDVRDSYIAKLPEGPELIQEYYKTAPHAVAAIQARPDANNVWKHIYVAFIRPAVRAAEQGNMADSYATYLSLVHWVDDLIGDKG